MKPSQKDIAELFDILWSEERVEKILSCDWEKLLEETLKLSKDITESINALTKLETKNHKMKYIDCLSENLKNSLLVILAKELKKNENNVIQPDFNTQSVDDDFDELNETNLKKVVFH